MERKKAEAIYTEDRSAGNAYRVAYREDILALIERRQQELYAQRDAFGKKLMEDREAAREEYREMLGWPLTEPAYDAKICSSETLRENDQVIVSRVQIEALPGLRFYGVLMCHRTAEKLPLVISQHGGLGAPELCSSFFDSGNYNDMSMRVFHRGVNVFAPQLLLWKDGELGKDAKRDEIANDLRRIGGSIAALEIYCIMRALDVFEKAPWCTGDFGMVGLSYGSFYTIYTTACDTRIKGALACSLFSKWTHCFGTDFSWRDSWRRFGDAEVAALVYPRALRIEYGDKDPLVHVVEDGEAEFERLKTYYADAQDNLSFRVFEGVHEFCPEDDGIEWMLERVKRA